MLAYKHGVLRSSGVCGAAATSVHVFIQCVTRQVGASWAVNVLCDLTVESMQGTAVLYDWNGRKGRIL